MTRKSKLKSRHRHPTPLPACLGAKKPPRGVGVKIAGMGPGGGSFDPGMFGGGQGGKEKKKMPLGEARKILRDQALNSRIDQESLKQAAIRRAENYGIIFLDEIDKLASSSGTDSTKGGISHSSHHKGEGVQKELLTLIE